jgi:hypothetical protein
MLLGTVLWAVASLETGIGPIVAARPEVVISLRSKALMIGKKGRAERTRRESHGSAEGIIFSRNIPFIWSLLIYTRKRTRTSFSIHPYLRFPFIRFILPCIYPFGRPSSRSSIYPSLKQNTFKPSAHSLSRRLHTRTSLPADGAQAEPGVHST